MRNTPPLETIISLSIYVVISTVIIYLLYMLLCWLLIDYEIISPEYVPYSTMWVTSCGCA